MRAGTGHQLAGAAGFLKHTGLPPHRITARLEIGLKSVTPQHGSQGRRLVLRLRIESLIDAVAHPVTHVGGQPVSELWLSIPRQLGSTVTSTRLVPLNAEVVTQPLTAAEAADQSPLGD
jgi:hypothetical protein